MNSNTARNTAQIKIESAGLLSTLQDTGRRGLRHLGVPWSGALVPAWQQLANALAGNQPDTGILEVFEGGLQLRVNEANVRIAVMGASDLDMQARHAEGNQSIRPGRSYLLSPGTTLKLNTTGGYRHAVIAIHALQTEPQLGSCSTYAKAGLGGIRGDVLRTGDVLLAAEAAMQSEVACKDTEEAHLRDTTLRVVLGPQQDHFSEEAISTFLNSDYELSSEADRMGARLIGPVLEHRDSSARDIISDAIVPGSIQVPGNGQPIVLLNDAQTAGGYPKIATVLSMDLPRLGLHRTGSRFRFQALDTNEAIDLVRGHAGKLRRSLENLTPVQAGLPSTTTLLTHNLIDGVTDGSVS